MRRWMRMRKFVRSLCWRTEGLDPKLRQRLDGIAAQSGGQVPLHGRLFAQLPGSNKGFLDGSIPLQ